MDKELNLEIAQYFLTDSREFLKRYDALSKNQTHIGNRSKLLIDIVFSLECSLKALIFIESSNNEKETYKKVITHDLRKLIGMVDTSSIKDIVIIIDENFEHFAISSRYTLEANIYFRDSFGVLGDLYYSTIADPKWLDSIHKKAVQFCEYVDSKIDRLEIIELDKMDIDKLLERTQCLKGLKK